MSAPTIDCATTQQQRVDELRHSGVRLALTALRHGKPQHALDIMLGSVEGQARIAGVRCELS